MVFRDLLTSLNNKIINNYKIFQQLDLDGKPFILPFRHPQSLYMDNEFKLESLLTTFRSYKDQKILHIVRGINKNLYTSWIAPEGPKSIIHGDASLNNMILDEQNNCVFLDFEMLRYGHTVEDFAELILSTILPNYVFHTPKKVLTRLINQVNTNFSFTKQDWRHGIRLYFLYFINRRIYGTKFLKSMRKDYLFILHLKKYGSIMKVLDQLY